MEVDLAIVRDELKTAMLEEAVAAGRDPFLAAQAIDKLLNDPVFSRINITMKRVN